jgi:hypothetical protein
MHRSDFVVIRSPGRRGQATEAVSSWTGCTPSRSTRHRPIPARRARRAPTFGEHAGAVLARRTATDNDDVVSVAHDGSGLPACSRIMYSAHQLVQSASRLPVRFSCSPCAASARRSALASSVGEVNVVTSASTRPGRRARRRKLYGTILVALGELGVESPTKVAVRTLGAIEVRNRDDDNLDV